MRKADSLEMTLMLGKREEQEKRATEDKTVRWHHLLDGHEFEQTQGDGEGQGSLACCSPWDCKESNVTEWLNNHHHHHRRLGPSPDLLGDENFTSSYSAILTVGIRNLFWAVTWKLFPCVESYPISDSFHSGRLVLFSHKLCVCIWYQIIQIG